MSWLQWQRTHVLVEPPWFLVFDSQCSVEPVGRNGQSPHAFPQNSCSGIIKERKKPRKERFLGTGPDEGTPGDLSFGSACPSNTVVFKSGLRAICQAHRAQVPATPPPSPTIRCTINHAEWKKKGIQACSMFPSSAAFPLPLLLA